MLMGKKTRFGRALEISSQASSVGVVLVAAQAAAESSERTDSQWNNIEMELLRGAHLDIRERVASSNKRLQAIFTSRRRLCAKDLSDHVYPRCHVMPTNCKGFMRDVLYHLD